jgi:tripeptidyl-peptidase I
MRLSALFGGLVALAATVSAKPLRRSSKHVLHEKRAVAARQWDKFSRPHRSDVLPVRIGLTQQNLHRADEFIYDVAHPDSPNYGKHWSKQKIVETFAPKQETVDLVLEWVEAEGIRLDRVRISKSRNWLTFNATVREVEQLLKTEYHIYKHIKHGQSHVACEEYHIPEHLSEHVDLVVPTVHFDQRIGHERRKKTVRLSEEEQGTLTKRALTKRQRPEKGIIGLPTDANLPKQGAMVENALMDINQCDTMITPACLRALYATPPGTLASTNNTLGIVEYTPQAFLQSDLNTYFASFQEELVGKEPIVQLLDNGVVQTTNRSFNFNGESALDLEFAMALIYPQQATLFQVGDLVQGASFNNFLDSIDGDYCGFQGGNSKDPSVDGQYAESVSCGTHSPTNVISTSYSYNEGDLTFKYEQRQCDEYMKLGLQGVSMLFSSGDYGVAGNGGQCFDSLTGAYNNGSKGLFNPAFPATCPYVTAVGATQLLNGTSVRGKESAAARVIFSGGGFSNFFPMPDYQKEAVASYFTNSNPPYGAERFNNSKFVRGYPDVAANGANYVTVVNGNFSLTYGTSGKSAPPSKRRCVVADLNLFGSVVASVRIDPKSHQREADRSRQEHDRLRQPCPICPP